MANYDLLGNIAVIKFPNGKSKEEKLSQAQELLKIPSIKTVFEKVDKVKGRLRTIKVEHIAGEKNYIAEHRESGCVFKFDIRKCYFSPRMSNDRIYISSKINKKDNVLVMFAGISPYSIVIAKLAKPKKIVSIELGKECSRYAKINVIKNKVENIVEIIQGDVKKKIPEIKKKGEKFDVIVMARPNLEETFLKEALSVAKKDTRIFYHGFSAEDKKQNMLNKLITDAKKAKKAIKITNVREIGDIAPYEHRYNVEILVTN